ncbi:hypothetical protein TELCIR_06241, partial [Teladorsagia circumcincta]
MNRTILLLVSLFLQLLNLSTAQFFPGMGMGFGNPMGMMEGAMMGAIDGAIMGAEEAAMMGRGFGWGR